MRSVVDFFQVYGEKTAPAVIRKPFDMIIERRRSEMCLVIEEIMSERLAIKAVVAVPLLI